MLIIDSQVHIWAPATPEKPYATGNASTPHRPVPLGAEELVHEMDGAGVARCVLVPPTWEADRNDTSLEAARLHPDRFRVMGRLALTDPNGRALMAAWKRSLGLSDCVSMALLRVPRTWSRMAMSVGRTSF